MIPRLLSLAGPLSVYASLAALLYGLWLERRRLDWLAGAPALIALALSLIFVPSGHRLFFDEDIYIGIARNLTHAPVYQVTVYGSPDQVMASSYYKEPPGWPVVLSLAFLASGNTEEAAFRFTRLLFALAIAAVYHLALELLQSRVRALAAASLFGAAPVVFWFSASAGNDIPAALMAVLGMWGLFRGNGALASAGLALAAQTRMELFVLVLLVWFSKSMPSRWKLVAAAMTATTVAHVAWVISIAPALAKAERVRTPFSPAYFLANLGANAGYLLSPVSFVAVATVLAGLALYRAWRTRKRFAFALSVQIMSLLGIYSLFYAGSFQMNPRYSIQILAPIVILAGSLVTRATLILLLSILLPYARSFDAVRTGDIMAADHRASAEFASKMNSGDLVVSAQHDVLLNHGMKIMSSLYAVQHREVLEAAIRQGTVWYHAGVRATGGGTEESEADEWIHANFELQPAESKNIEGQKVAFYRMFPKR